MVNSMNNEEIKAYLPHRYPFLLVDKVQRIEANKSIKAIKNVTSNEPCFIGHFPVRSVMPGVLIVEALAQAAGILMAKSLDWPKHYSNVFFLAGIDHVRFKRVVEPGDSLALEVHVLKQRRDLWKFSGKASVENELASSAEFMTIRGEGLD